MPDVRPVVFGTVGLGGYAGGICDLLLTLSGDAPSPGNPGNPGVKLVAACEPDHVTHAAKIAELRAKGIKVFDKLEEMLALREIEAVWLPLPIDLHRPFTEQALAAGKAVICEKPVAGSVDDADAMIAARDRAKLPVAIGYQDVYDPTTIPLKRKLLAGEIGKISHATVHACWPRTDLYFGRNGWAGKFKRNGVWVMDSPPNNALAHYINIPLFLLGPTLETPATPVAVEAELYRANAIENFDTISLRVTLEGAPGSGSATLLVLFTHACEELIHPEVVLHGSKGVVRRTNERVVIQTPAGEQVMPRGGDGRPNIVRRFVKAVRGIADPEVALATLEVARAQIVAVNAASEATPIYDIPPSDIRVIDAHGGKLTCANGLEAAFTAAVAKNQMLHESGLLKWTKPAGRKTDLRGYRHFAGPMQAKGAATKAGV